MMMMMTFLSEFVIGLALFMNALQLGTGQEVNLYSSSDPSGVSKSEERYSMIGGSGSQLLNLTGILNKQVKLPCVVERDRKFIWMRSERDEIISIDRTLISNDKRLSLDSSRCLAKQARGVETSAAGKDDCLVSLVINELTVNDEGLYLCQIDTMISTKIFLSVLGTLKDALR